MILGGDIPYVNVEDEIDVVLQHAMTMCLQVDPAKRSSAIEVYNYLKNESDSIQMWRNNIEDNH